MSLFILEGKVEKGKSRGKALGFPTINFPLTQQIPEGIYLSKIKIDSKLYNALTFIGTAQTFGDTKLQTETYVLDFDKDVYGQTVKVSLLKKIRNNQKFESKEKLIHEIENDVKKARNFFNT